MRFRNHKPQLTLLLASVLLSGCFASTSPPEAGQPSTACRIEPSPTETDRLLGGEERVEVGPDEVLAIRIDKQDRQSMFGTLDVAYIVVDTDVDFTWEDAKYSTEPGAFSQRMNIGDDFGTTYVFDVPPSTYTVFLGRVTSGAIGTCPKV